jgi:transcriptional regulator with XRE-family HTH domain
MSLQAWASSRTPGTVDVVSRQFNEAIAERLRQARQRAGWTQEQLAVTIGIEPANLSRYETAKVPVPLDVLWRASNALGTNLATLVDVSRNLPKRLVSPPPINKRPMRGEEAALVKAWSALPPRDRATIILLCNAMKKRRGAPS